MNFLDLKTYFVRTKGNGLNVVFILTFFSFLFYCSSTLNTPSVVDYLCFLDLKSYFLLWVSNTTITVLAEQHSEVDEKAFV